MEPFATQTQPRLIYQIESEMNLSVVVYSNLGMLFRKWSPSPLSPWLESDVEIRHQLILPNVVGVVER